MCVILYNPNGVKYDERELRNACATNDDGFGVMWLENGKVKSFRGILSADEIVNTLLNEFDGVPNIVHLRFATHGPVVPDLCHPFKVTPDDADQTVLMMHNGVLSEHGHRAKAHESDTLVFARDRANDVRQFGTSDIFFDDDYMAYMEGVISGDRMIFLRDDGKVAILSQKNWYVDEETGIWYSNRYSVADRPRYNPRSWAHLASTALAANKAAAASSGGTQDPETFAELADAMAEEEWIKQFGRDATAPLPKLLTEGEDDEEDAMFYFKWDDETNDFVTCDEEDADIEVEADEYFSRLSENEGNQTATLLELVAENSDEEDDEKSERYHNMIDDFLNDYRASLGADAPTPALSSVED